MAFDALPPIDLVLIAYNHYEHVDLDTLARFDAHQCPRALVQFGNARTVQADMPARMVSEHDWWAVVPVGALRATFGSMLLGSGRTVFDQQRTRWADSVLEAAGLASSRFVAPRPGPALAARRDRVCRCHSQSIAQGTAQGTAQVATQRAVQGFGAAPQDGGKRLLQGIRPTSAMAAVDQRPAALECLK